MEAEGGRANRSSSISFDSSTVELPQHGCGGLGVRIPLEAVRVTEEKAKQAAQRYEEGRNKKEIAATLGLSEASVGQVLSGAFDHRWSGETVAALNRARETWSGAGKSKRCRACRLLLPNTEEHFQQRNDTRHYADVRCRRCVSAYYRERNKTRRLKALTHYGGDPPRCACCGESAFEFLAIDHINGGGGKHRREIKNKFPCIIRWLGHHNYPPGFRVLCHNCNCALGHYGYCPHGNLPVSSVIAKVAQEPKAEVDHLGA